MLIDTESGQKIDPGPTEAPKQSPGLSHLQLAELRRLKNLDRLQEIISSCVRGDLPRERELKAWEPSKLMEKHIQICFDRLAGMTNIEIGEKWELHPDWIGAILNHPDAQYLMSTVSSMSADRLTDVNERLIHAAPEALNTKVELMRHSKMDTVRDKAATDLLEMAGYGKKRQERLPQLIAPTAPVQNIQQNVFVMPAHAATSLAETLKEAQRVSLVDYSEHLAGSRKDEVIGEYRQLEGSKQPADNLQLGTGHPSADLGASPEAPSEIPSRELEEALALADEREAREEARKRRSA